MVYLIVIIRIEYYSTSVPKVNVHSERTKIVGGGSKKE